MKNKVSISTFIILIISFMMIYAYPSFAVVSSEDFTIELTGSLSDSVLTVHAKIGAPRAYAGDFCAVPCDLYLGDTSLGVPSNAIVVTESTASSTGKYGDITGYSVTKKGKTKNVTYLIFGTTSGTDLVEKGEKEFVLTYDVSKLNCSEGSVVTLKGAAGQNGYILANWGSEQVFSENEVISTFTVEPDSATILTTIPSSSIINNADGIATVTGTVSDGTATLNVASEKACVVAYTTDDGATYNRLTATANSEGGYDFVVPDYSESMKFVVAVKGDVNGDGLITAGDWGTLVEAYNGAELSALNGLIGDVNGDGQITSTDWGTLVEAYNGSALSWNN